jgi:hypothetical protein
MSRLAEFKEKILSREQSGNSSYRSNETINITKIKIIGQANRGRTPSPFTPAAEEEAASPYIRITCEPRLPEVKISSYRNGESPRLKTLPFK